MISFRLLSRLCVVCTLASLLCNVRTEPPIVCAASEYRGESAVGG